MWDRHIVFICKAKHLRYVLNGVHDEQDRPRFFLEPAPVAVQLAARHKQANPGATDIPPNQMFFLVQIADATPRNYLVLIGKPQF